MARLQDSNNILLTPHHGDVPPEPLFPSHPPACYYRTTPSAAHYVNPRVHLLAQASELFVRRIPHARRPLFLFPPDRGAHSVNLRRANKPTLHDEETNKQT
eukprot:8137267-Pyramimonas_sp.AAC.2